jgi:hypothetical protein
MPCFPSANATSPELGSSAQRFSRDGNKENPVIGTPRACTLCHASDGKLGRRIREQHVGGFHEITHQQGVPRQCTQAPRARVEES